MKNPNPETDKRKEIKSKFAILNIQFLFGINSVASFLSVANTGLAHTHLNMIKRLIDFSALDKPTKGQKADFRLIKAHEEMQAEYAKAAVNSAAIIYTHAMLDATIFRLCELSIFVEPQAWFPFIQERKVTFSSVQSKSIAQVQTELLQTYLVQLERDSLLVKCDRLFMAIKPKNSRAVLEKYQYSRTRLASLDDLRHELVHKLKFSGKLQHAESKIGYLQKTGEFFIKLIAAYYNIQVISKPNNLSAEHPFMKELLKYHVADFNTTLIEHVITSKLESKRRPAKDNSSSVAKIDGEQSEDQKNLNI